MNFASGHEFVDTCMADLACGGTAIMPRFTSASYLVAIAPEFFEKNSSVFRNLGYLNISYYYIYLTMGPKKASGKVQSLNCGLNVFQN